MIDFNKDGVYLENDGSEEFKLELLEEMVDKIPKEKLKQIEEYSLFGGDIVWSHYKMFDLFTGNDQCFNPNSITPQMIKHNSQLLLDSFGNKSSTMHSFVWKCFNELKINKSKYDQEERKKVAFQKLEMNRISKLILTFESSKFFSIHDHLKLRFFHYQILGFTTNTGNFKYQKISKEEFEKKCQEFQRIFKDCGDESVVVYINNCEKNLHYFWFKLNYLSNIFQKGFWKSTQFQQRIAQLPTGQNGVFGQMVSIFYHIFSLFYLFDDLFQSISKDLINPMLRLEYFISSLFFSILFYINSGSVFIVPVEEFFSFKFSFVFGIFFGVFFVFFQGIPILFIYLFYTSIRKNLSFSRILSILLCFYLIFAIYNYWSYLFSIVKSRFPSSIIQWIFLTIFSIVKTLSHFIFIIINYIFHILKALLLFMYYLVAGFLNLTFQILKFCFQMFFSLSYPFQIILFLLGCCFVFLICIFF
jgi:hypothetical protein